MCSLLGSSGGGREPGSLAQPDWNASKSLKHGSHPGPASAVLLPCGRLHVALSAQPPAPPGQAAWRWPRPGLPAAPPCVPAHTSSPPEPAVCQPMLMMLLRGGASLLRRHVPLQAARWKSQVMWMPAGRKEQAAGTCLDVCADLRCRQRAGSCRLPGCLQASPCTVGATASQGPSRPGHALMALQRSAVACCKQVHGVQDAGPVRSAPPSASRADSAAWASSSSATSCRSCVAYALEAAFLAPVSRTHSSSSALCWRVHALQPCGADSVGWLARHRGRSCAGVLPREQAAALAGCTATLPCTVLARSCEGCKYQLAPAAAWLSCCS